MNVYTIRMGISNLDIKRFYGMVISFLIDLIGNMVKLLDEEKGDIISIDGKESPCFKCKETSTAEKKPLHPQCIFQ